jgi:hypothetical protein
MTQALYAHMNKKKKTVEGNQVRFYQEVALFMQIQIYSYSSLFLQT